jgi:hypothetical protein
MPAAASSMMSRLPAWQPISDTIPARVPCASERETR